MMPGGAARIGPYETAEAARLDAHHFDDLTPTADIRMVLQLRKIVAACRAAGVELGTYDRQVIWWIAAWQPEEVQVIAGLILRARRTVH